MFKNSPIAMPLFKIAEDCSARNINFEFEGSIISAQQGLNIAAALLINGLGPFRQTPADGNPRSAFCMMGVCFDCLVEVDGIPNRQACQISIEDGMIVKRQCGASLLPLNIQEIENE